LAVAAPTTNIPLPGTSETMAIVLSPDAATGGRLLRAETAPAAVTAPSATIAEIKVWRIIADTPFVRRCFAGKGSSSFIRADRLS
jgi:hypothetical protein